MIINISRAKQRLLCRKKSFNTYHRGLTEPNKSMNLVDGSAFHKGVAHGLATKDWEGAFVEAKASFIKEQEGVIQLPGTEWQMYDHWTLCEKMIQCYADAFKDQGIQVIQPECEFEVELPGTRHNCIWIHHLELSPDVHLNTPPTTSNSMEKWGPPDPKAILEGRVKSPHYWSAHYSQGPVIAEDPTLCKCWQPHRFVGKTDAIVVWMGNIWLLEHKTTSISGEQFWTQWRLDIQPTGYIYGIQKALNTKVSGFILNAINKPSEGQVANWNKKRKSGPDKGIVDYIGYSREAFLRSPEDLLRFEHELITLCNDWERDIVSGSFPMSPLAGICNQYNRTCEFHSMCTCHDAQSEIEALGQRRVDYVDEKLIQLAGKGEEDGRTDEVEV